LSCAGQARSPDWPLEEFGGPGGQNKKFLPHAGFSGWISLIAEHNPNPLFARCNCRNKSAWQSGPTVSARSLSTVFAKSLSGAAATGLATVCEVFVFSDGYK
jgi:hypothetical protein